MAMHKFDIGQEVLYHPRRKIRGVPPAYTVVRVLPSEDGHLQYRIKAEQESFERVVRESELTSSSQRLEVRFNYAAKAELFSAAEGGTRRKSITYKRFDAAADALRFAMEKLELPRLPGTILEVEEVRYDSAAIRELYESSDYPLQRCAFKEVP